MGCKVSRTDYEWTYTEEPHATRRKEILAKYPQIKSLFGHDPSLKYIVTAMIILQVITAYLVRDASWQTIILVGYCWGGVINHSMTLAIHEIAHNLAFGYASPLKNRLLGIWANLPLGIPYSISFKKYHLEHHKFQGDEALDTDIPCLLEAKLFNNTFTKLLWVILQPLFYCVRPLLMQPKRFTTLELLNVGAQILFDAIILQFMGWRSLVYLCTATFLAMGLHPVAGHFISEHYMFRKGFETYSYYGSLNRITFNVGYHNEHHDFPNIPGSRLPQVRKIAPEFYENLPCHTSWVRVIWDFITDPEIGPYARVRRKHLTKVPVNHDD